MLGKALPAMKWALVWPMSGIRKRSFGCLNLILESWGVFRRRIHFLRGKGPRLSFPFVRHWSEG